MKLHFRITLALVIAHLVVTPTMVGNEMAVNHRHGNIMMSQNLLDRDEINTLHNEVGSERMTKRVEGNPVVQSGLLDKLSKSCSKPPVTQFANRVVWRWFRCRHSFEHLAQIIMDGSDPGPAGFGPKTSLVLHRTMSPRISVDNARIRQFCQKWNILEMSLFGSVLRDDFGPDSDIDVLVTFAPETRYSLFQLSRMQREMKDILGHEVDLIERSKVETSDNTIRRRHVLQPAQRIYAA